MKMMTEAEFMQSLLDAYEASPGTASTVELTPYDDSDRRYIVDLDPESGDAQAFLVTVEEYETIERRHWK
jgi:hypothetical protein